MLTMWIVIGCLFMTGIGIRFTYRVLGLTRVEAAAVFVLIALVAMTFLGLYTGLWLDKITGMAPNFTLLLLILGIALGFKGFVKEVVIERRKRA